MRTGWKVKKLGELTDQITDGTHNSPPYVEAGIPMLDSKNVQEGFVIDDTTATKFISPSTDALLSKRCKPRAGDILISSRGSIGKIALVGDMGEDFNIMGNMILVRPCDELDRAFAAFYLHSQVVHLESIAKGVAQKGFILNQIRDFEIPLPALHEQQRIVGLLNEAFEGLATAKANAEQNLDNARTIFEGHVQTVFAQRGKGSVERKLSEVCAITSTLVDPRRNEFLDLTHVGAGNIESKTGVFVDLKTAREEGLISGKFLFDESMVLYSKIRPYLMKVARPDFPGLCSADMYPLVPFPKEISRDYLFHLLLSKPFTDYAVVGSARAGMPKVNREHLFEFKVWLPDLKTQKQLAANLDEVHEETQRLAHLYERKLAALEALKQSLLHQAFSG